METMRIQKGCAFDDTTVDMAARVTRQTSFMMPLLWPAIALVFGLILAVGPGRPRALVVIDGDAAYPLELDPHLQLLPAAMPPGPALEVGDRIIEVNGVPVTSAAQLMAVLGTTVGEVHAGVELRNRLETVVLTGRSFDGELPSALISPHTVLALDGDTMRGGTTIAGLRDEVNARGGAPLDVEVEYSDRVFGPMRIVRTSAQPLVVAWLIFGAILLVLGLLRPGLVVDRDRLVALALCAGATVPLAALQGVLLSAFVPRLLLWWAVSTNALWFGLAALHRTGRRRARMGRVVVALLPSMGLMLALSAWGLMRGPGLDAASHQAELLGGAVVVAYSFWIALERRGQGAAFVASMSASAAATLCLVGAAWGGVAVASSLVSAACILATGTGVIVLLANTAADSSDGAAGGRRRQKRQSGNALDGLRALASTEGAEGTAFAVGLDASFVLVRLVGQGPEQTLTTVMAPPELSDALGMLVAEQTSYPSPLWVHDADESEHNPFHGVFERLGVAASVRRPRERADDSTLEIFGIVFGRQAEVDVDRIQTLVVESLSDEVATELGVMVWLRRESIAASLVASVSETVADHEFIGSVQPAASPENVLQAPPGQSASEPSSEAEGAARTLAEWAMERSVARHALDDPDALNESEWKHLRSQADSKNPLLLSGEPGIGKEFLARAIHSMSPRAEQAFLVVDCASEPASLIAQRVLGDDEEPGLLEAIAGGGLLLKAGSLISEDDLQRVLRVARKWDVRLYFAERYDGTDATIPPQVNPVIRRAVGKAHMPLTPLRERRSDVARYALVFCHRWSMTYEKEVTDLSPEAVRFLQQLDLPGNFHDLRAVIRSAVLRTDSEILTVDDLTGGQSAEDAADVDSSDYDENEKSLIVDALERAAGNRSEAARQLDMTRGKLLRRMKRYEIQ
jgi:transcriptional regulator with AAA-type ATPase domain